MTSIAFWLNMFFLLYKQSVFCGHFLAFKHFHKKYWNTCKINGSGIILQGLDDTLLGLDDKLLDLDDKSVVRVSYFKVWMIHFLI